MIFVVVSAQMSAYTEPKAAVEVIGMHYTAVRNTLLIFCFIMLRIITFYDLLYILAKELK